jgi:hypothetical protein
MSDIHDFIVVGSGCTGAMAAQTIVEGGEKVCMLDVGKLDSRYSSLIPDKDFNSIRKEEKDQYKYLIGEDFEGIPWGELSTGSQLTPSRKYITEAVDTYLKLDSKTFSPLESLALGGLGSGWGLGSCVYSKEEMDKTGLDDSKILEAYNWVSERIGISGKKDDAGPYTIGHLNNYQPGIEADINSKVLYSEYLKKRKKLNVEGFYLGQPALALLTKDLNGRKAFGYKDMDFYSDKEKSAYRPWITIDEFKKNPHFNYITDKLVLKFSEADGIVSVHCLDTNTNEVITYKTRKLILTPGVLGTARIVLRSLTKDNNRLPIMSNRYCYIPCIQPKMMGKEIEQYKTTFAQLSLFHDDGNKNINIAMASLYSYRSLMLFRLIKEMPINYNDGRILMRYLLSGFMIMGIHHPEEASESKYLALEKDTSSPTGDKMRVEYILSEEEKKYVHKREDKFVAALRSLGCYALKRVYPGYGASIHYAGTLPFNKENKPFTVHPEGRLNGTQNVYIADGSGFKFLPAKGLTFSLMANAHNVAESLLK